MKILVTGGTTFVSKFTAEYFVSKDNEVFVLNRGSKPQIDGVHLIECDRNHLDRQLYGKYFDVILDITAYNENDVEYLLNSGVSFKDYIFISSSAVYPETNPQPFAENQTCGYNSVWKDYGSNKLKAEIYLQEHCPNAYILRPPYLYGIYNNLYREAFVFDCAMNDRPFYLPQQGNMTLQFFNVADLCRFIEILIKKHPENMVFNVGNKEIVTVKEWVTLCYQAVGKIPKFVTVDKSVNQRDYFCFYDYEYTLDVARQYQLMPNVISLEQGLQKELLWYKENPDSIGNRKNYRTFIDEQLKNRFCYDKK